jgi:hypothetical protein
MLLQMVFEKLAKAALLRSGGVTVPRATGTHVAASRLTRCSRSRLAPASGAPLVPGRRPLPKESNRVRAAGARARRVASSSCRLSSCSGNLPSRSCGRSSLLHASRVHRSVLIRASVPTEALICIPLFPNWRFRKLERRQHQCTHVRVHRRERRRLMFQLERVAPSGTRATT